MPITKSVRSSAPRALVSARFQIAPSLEKGSLDFINTSLAWSPLSRPFVGPTVAKMREKRALSSGVIGTSEPAAGAPDAAGAPAPSYTGGAPGICTSDSPMLSPRCARAIRRSATANAFGVRNPLLLLSAIDQI